MVDALRRAALFCHVIISGAFSRSAHRFLKGWKVVELVENADEVELAPVLDEQAVLEANQVKPGDADWSMRRHDAEYVAAVGSPPGDAGDDRIVLGDDL